MKPRPVKIRIVRQGGPIVNEGCICAQAKNVVAIYVDMKSKHCEVAASTCHRLWVEPTESSLHLKPGRESEPTEISFPEFRGWSIHCAECSRYTLSVCLVREEK